MTQNRSNPDITAAPSSTSPSSLRAVTQARQAAQWQRNKPSIYVDLGLGLFFFVCAKFTDLSTAALLGAAAGLSVYLVQRFVQVDLLGGLAMFGVLMLLVSAGFSWLLQDDWAVKMKGTILGLLTASLFLGDGLLNRGRYFGRRLARYVMEPVVEQRLAIGLGLLGALMALLNWGVAEFFSTDVWLAYTTFGDIALSMLLFFAVLRFARA
jgi:intracellular septation protein A